MRGRKRCVDIHKPQFVYAEAGIDFSFEIAIKIGGGFGEDFNDEIGRAFDAAISAAGIAFEIIRQAKRRWSH